MKGDPTLHMFLVEKTERAVKVTGKAERPCDGMVMFFHWIPRSLIGYSRTLPALTPDKFPNFDFTLPEWKVDQLGLWEHVGD